MGSLRSVIVGDVTKLTKLDPEFINRKKNNDSSKREYLPGHVYNTSIFRHACEYYLDKTNIDHNELEHCKGLLSKAHYFRSHRILHAVNTFKKSTRKTR